MIHTAETGEVNVKRGIKTQKFHQCLGAWSSVT